MIHIFIAGLLGYLLGCIPTAYLVRKRTSGTDITTEGTGNVGARNLYDVSGSVLLAVLTMLVDVAKGGGAVLLGRAIAGDDVFLTAGAAGAGAVWGHTYNVFLRGKGGRGLATAAGVSLALNPIFLLTWIAMYLVGYYIIRRDVHIGSMTGIIASVLLMLSTPAAVLETSTLLPIRDAADVRVLVTLLCVPLFMRHVAPVREVIRQMSEESEESEG